eukprot:SRR837773.20829.p1 GENE.SRR837773.20829~~SRR837773.20829.p1  ORF type:complete len:112 (-),score=11.53 SRR837773.20829:131-442(-)
MVEVVECMVQPDDAEADAKLPWQVRVRPEFVGAKYVDLFMDLIQDPVHPVLPVGIYRQFASKAVPGNRGFVWTNPRRTRSCRPRTWSTSSATRVSGSWPTPRT